MSTYFPLEPTDVYGRCVLPCLDCKVKETEISRLKLELLALKSELKGLKGENKS